MQTKSLQNKLNSGLTQLELTLTSKQKEQLLSYLYLIQKWNKTYNLTAITNLEEMLVLHLFDSLAIVKFIPKHPITLLDVGTGAGLPSIPLSIVCPNINATPLDRTHKKIRFLQHVKQQLDLPNVHPTVTRIETHTSEPYDIITARAFAEPNQFVTLSEHLASKKSHFFIMQSQATIQANLAWLAHHHLKIPGSTIQRYLHIGQKKT
jgi:16S rRNA (guanine527-N7)-methyltransferase